MKKYLWIFVLALLLSTPVSAQETSGTNQETQASSKVYPKKVEVDKNHDGKVDHVEYFENGKIVRSEDDTDYDGTMDEQTTYENGKPVKSERDTDHDGKPDTWITY